MTETNFPKYEIMAILQPDLGEEKTTEVLNELKELIKEASGKIFHEDIWGLRELAYMIKHQKQGYYVVFDFTADPVKVKEFEKQLNINPAIVRYLIQKTPKYHEIKTLAEYEEIARAEELKAKEEEKEKAEKMESRSGRGRKFERREKPERPMETVKKEKPAEKSAKKPEKEEKPVKEEKKPVKKVKKEEPVEEKVEEEKPKSKKQAATLEDVDAKLKSIIDDPDITL